MATRRLHGKNGQIWLQNGSTAVAGPTTCNGNAAIETVDGIAFDPYQVWTNSVGGNIPMDPSTVPVVTVAVGGGPALPPAYTYEINYLRGKLIVTPALASGNTVSVSTYATPKLYAQGDVSDWAIDMDEDLTDSSAQMQGTKSYAKGLTGWKGSATVYWKGTDFWSVGPGGSADAPFVCRFYPARGVATEYWYGAAFFNWGIKTPKGGMVEQSVSFTGSSPLVYVA